MLREFDYENMPVADIVNEIIIDAVKRGASDIHLDPRPEFLMVRIRIDGELVDYTTLPLGIKNHITTKIKILASMNIEVWIYVYLLYLLFMEKKLLFVFWIILEVWKGLKI